METLLMFALAALVMVLPLAAVLYAGRGVSATNPYASPSVLPVLAFGQVWVGMPFIGPLREPGTDWSAGQVLFAVAFGLVGAGVVALAVRNHVRLWRMPAGHGSWGLLVALLVPAVLSGLFATGPLMFGRVDTRVVLCVLQSASLLALLAREARRMVRPAVASA